MTGKAEVERFWDEHPLGGSWTSHKSKMKWRYEREPWIADIINSADLKNKKVLEVGCGPGLDTALLCMAGAKVTALDLSKESLRWAKKGLGEMGLKAKLVHGDAEKLPFKNESFDFVYSYGVLHHTPNTQKAIDEIHRVLKRGGSASIMLYRKFAPQWVVITSIRGLPHGMREALFGFVHRILGIAQRANNPEHGTSLFELFRCPVLHMFSKNEAKSMFRNFEKVKIDCYQTGLGRIPEYVKVAPKGFLRWLDWKLQKRLGFYMVISASR